MKALFIVLISFLITSCTKDGNKNEVVARRMFDAFNKHDWRAMSHVYKEGAAFLDPSYGTEYVAKSNADIEAKYAEMANTFPDLHDEVIGLSTSGNKVFAEFVATGTMSDGKRFKLPLASVFTIEGDYIVRDATYYDLQDQ